MEEVKKYAQSELCAKHLYSKIGRISILQIYLS